MVQDFKPSTDPPSGQSPLREFRGIVDAYHSDSRQFTNDDGSTRNSINIVFDIRDLEVLKATEPYPFPITTIGIPYTPPVASRGANRWEAFSKSLRDLMPDVDGQERLDKLVGQSQVWAYKPAKLRVPSYEDDGVTVKIDGRNRQVWVDGVGDAWQVVSIDGVAQPEDLTDYIAGLAEGKTEQQWHQALMTDSKVISRPDVVTSITERRLLDTLVLANKISRDSEGVLHKV